MPTSQPPGPSDDPGREPPPQPGPPSYEPSFLGGPVHIGNNLVWAILATICCCLPTGIVAIVYAAQVNGKLAVGDYAGAQQYANNARTWSIISLALGLGFGVLYVISVVIGGITEGILDGLLGFGSVLIWPFI